MRGALLRCGVLVLVMGCGGGSAASSNEVVAPKAWQMGHATMQIDKIWSAVGLYVQVHGGRTFVVYGGYNWPTILSDDKGIYPPTDPIYADVLASVKAARPSADVPASAIDEIVHTMTVAPVVIDPDWSDVAIVKVTRARGFEIELRKKQMKLVAEVWRHSTHDYRPDWAHGTNASVERQNIGAEAFAGILEHAKVGPDVDRALLAETLRLLHKPATFTQTQEE